MAGQACIGCTETRGNAISYYELIKMFGIFFFFFFVGLELGCTLLGAEEKEYHHFTNKSR